MSGQRYTPEFKDEAVRQVTERGYSVADISKRLGVSVHSLYKWVNAVKPGKCEEQAEELALDFFRPGHFLNDVIDLPGFDLRFVWLNDPDGVTNYFAKVGVRCE